MCYYDYLLDHLNQPRDVLGLTAIELMVGMMSRCHADHGQAAPRGPEGTAFRPEGVSEYVRLWRGPCHGSHRPEEASAVGERVAQELLRFTRALHADRGPPVSVGL